MRDLEGQALQVPSTTGTKDATLAIVATKALLDADVREDGAAKVRAFNLALRVHAGGEVDLSAEEIVLIKERIGLLYGPVVVGPAWALLEQRPVGQA